MKKPTTNNQISIDMAVISTKLDTVIENGKKLEQKLDTKVDCTDFEPVKKRNDVLWDNQNKAIGWMIGAGLVGGTTGALIKAFFVNAFEK